MILFTKKKKKNSYITLFPQRQWRAHRTSGHHWTTLIAHRTTVCRFNLEERDREKCTLHIQNDYRYQIHIFNLDPMLPFSSYQKGGISFFSPHKIGPSSLEALPVVGDGLNQKLGPIAERHRRRRESTSFKRESWEWGLFFDIKERERERERERENWYTQW